MQDHNVPQKMNNNFLLRMAFIAFLTISFLLSNHALSPAYATPCACCCSVTCGPEVFECGLACGCQSDTETTDVDLGNGIEGTLDFQVRYIQIHEEWLIKNVWEAHLLPAMMLMAQQLTTTAMQQVEIIGTFFDAKHQLESQRLLQTLMAEAHKDYHPSIGMCRFGTNTRSLAAADRNNEFNHIALAARSTQRILMNNDVLGGTALNDSRSRLVQFRTTYCNPRDFGNSLDLLCESGGAERRNKDVNYTHNIQNADTLLLNFANTGTTPDEEDVLALSANLYGNNIMRRVPNVQMATRDGTVIVDGANVYMKTRALAAKRSVAFNSFAAQAAMKSEGASSVLPYMTEILEEMGMPEDQIALMLRDNPSYHAQMEIMTKKLYQHPNFYSDLYDKPVNIDRKDTAIQAIALMQKRDMYKSRLRSEANMAVWLETILEDIQDEEGNEDNELKEDNEPISNLGL